MLRRTGEYNQGGGQPLPDCIQRKIFRCIRALKCAKDNQLSGDGIGWLLIDRRLYGRYNECSIIDWEA